MWSWSTSSSGTSAVASSFLPSRYSSCTRSASSAYPIRSNTCLWKFCSFAPMPPMYSDRLGRSASSTGAGSSVTCRWQVLAISKSSRVRRAPGRAKPSSSHGWYMPADAGE